MLFALDISLIFCNMAKISGQETLQMLPQPTRQKQKILTVTLEVVGGLCVGKEALTSQRSSGSC